MTMRRFTSGLVILFNSVRLRKHEDVRGEQEDLGFINDAAITQA